MRVPAHTDFSATLQRGSLASGVPSLNLARRSENKRRLGMLTGSRDQGEAGLV